ncbi:hypothetical protein B7R21_09025 [Subtercola boreus]|uniref:Uncharacterized protein n=2 Tax=Subtercola boreus TaxID=120213 RepID=A0A3E0VU00_9MICO|nr:hypothetical protein B7R21_09025 [Subtercola boreus]
MLRPQVTAEVDAVPIRQLHMVRPGTDSTVNEPVTEARLRRSASSSSPGTNGSSAEVISADAADQRWRRRDDRDPHRDTQEAAHRRVPGRETGSTSVV